MYIWAYTCLGEEVKLKVNIKFGVGSELVLGTEYVYLKTLIFKTMYVWKHVWKHKYMCFEIGRVLWVIWILFLNLGILIKNIWYIKIYMQIYHLLLIICQNTHIYSYEYICFYVH